MNSYENYIKILKLLNDINFLIKNNKIDIKIIEPSPMWNWYYATIFCSIILGFFLVAHFEKTILFFCGPIIFFFLAFPFHLFTVGLDVPYMPFYSWIILPLPEAKKEFEEEFPKKIEEIKEIKCDSKTANSKCEKYIKEKLLNPTNSLKNKIEPNLKDFTNITEAQKFLNNLKNKYENYKKEYNKNYLSEKEKWQKMNKYGLNITIKVLSENPLPIDISYNDLKIITSVALQKTKKYKNFKYYNSFDSIKFFKTDFNNIDLEDKISNEEQIEEKEKYKKDNLFYDFQDLPNVCKTDFFKENQLKKIIEEMDKN